MTIYDFYNICDPDQIIRSANNIFLAYLKTEHIALGKTCFHILIFFLQSSTRDFLENAKIPMSDGKYQVREHAPKAKVTTRSHDVFESRETLLNHEYEEHDVDIALAGKIESGKISR